MLQKQHYANVLRGWSHSPETFKEWALHITTPPKIQKMSHWYRQLASKGSIILDVITSKGEIQHPWKLLQEEIIDRRILTTITNPTTKEVVQIIIIRN